MSFHGKMMNLPMTLDARDAGPYANGYKQGHKDARHAAAELALKADALAEALRDMLMHIGKGREDGVEWVCEPIHHDEIKAAREALAALER
jgi:hypothetical protein